MAYQLLLVDDSVTVHKAVQITFACEDFNVIATTHAEEALQKARQAKIDIAIVDLHLQGADGYSVCQALKSDQSLAETPILLLGNNADPVDDARAQAAGASGHMLKPFETQALIERVRTLVGAPAGATIAPPMTATLTRATPSPASAPPAMAAVPKSPAPSTALPMSFGLSGASPTTSFTPVAAPKMTPPPAPQPAAFTPPARPPVTTPAFTATAQPAPRPATAPPATPVGFAPLAQPAARPPVATPPPLGSMGATPPGAPARMAPAAPPRPLAAPAPTSFASLATPAKPTALPSFAAAPAAPPTSQSPTPPARGTFGGPALGGAGFTSAPATTAPTTPPAAIAPSAPARTAAAMSGAVEQLAGLAQSGMDENELRTMAREIIERVVWDIVPELAETIIREQLAKQQQGL